MDEEKTQLQTEEPSLNTEINHMSKAQRKKLKKQKRKEELEVEKDIKMKKNKNNKIKSYVIIIAVILAIIGIFYWRSIPPENAPIIEITPSNYDFGTVSQMKGVVSGEVTIKNKGANDLIIDKLDTSCGCTSAALVDDGVEGPKFSMAMHGTNPTDWSQIIHPGESAKLRVYYDPNVHRELRGSVNRVVYIISNDPKNSKTQVRIHANQVN